MDGVKVETKKEKEKEIIVHSMVVFSEKISYFGKMIF